MTWRGLSNDKSSLTELCEDFFLLLSLSSHNSGMLLAPPPAFQTVWHQQALDETDKSSSAIYNLPVISKEPVSDS
jgi:hypothetical protein